MQTVSVSEARNNLAELLNQVAYGGESFVIRRMGKPVAILVRPEKMESIGRKVQQAIHPSKTAGTFSLPKGVKIGAIFEVMKEPYELESLLGR